MAPLQWPMQNMFQVTNARVMKLGLQLQMICSTGHLLKLLAHTESGWDCLQADGSICLLDTDWDGDHSVHTWDNKYWMTYIGGCLPGYEPDPLKMGIAWSDTLTPGSFTRLPDPI